MYSRFCEVIANYIQINMEPDKGIFDYEICFKPMQEGREISMKLLNQHTKLLGSARSLDGSTLSLPFQLPKQVFYI